MFGIIQDSAALAIGWVAENVWVTPFLYYGFVPELKVKQPVAVPSFDGGKVLGWI